MKHETCYKRDYKILGCASKTKTAYNSAPTKHYSYTCIHRNWQNLENCFGSLQGYASLYEGIGLANTKPKAFNFIDESMTKPKTIELDTKYFN